MPDITTGLPLFSSSLLEVAGEALERMTSEDGGTCMLMALYGDRPILIIVPKSLMIQWQEELWNLLEMPSARWNGWQWIDEQGVTYPEFSSQGMRKCPRRIGILSTGLIIRGSEAVDQIKDLAYECVILDEAHRARRSNLGPMHRGEKAGTFSCFAGACKSIHERTGFPRKPSTS